MPNAGGYASRRRGMTLRRFVLLLAIGIAIGLIMFARR
jgi:hypothetical protein